MKWVGAKSLGKLCRGASPLSLLELLLWCLLHLCLGVWMALFQLASEALDALKWG